MVITSISQDIAPKIVWFCSELELELRPLSKASGVWKPVKVQ